MNKFVKLFSFALLCTALSAQAQLKLPALFTDNMVLQQQSEANIWGWAEAGVEVTISTSWNSKSYRVKTDKSGKWKTSVSTPGAGGPYVLTIEADKKIEINNVLIGEVWLCSGQSNMEFPMRGYFGQPVANSNHDILYSGNSNIRFISVPRNPHTLPQNDFEGAWQEAKPGTVANFSAVAYYYAKVLNDILGIPVGLVETTYGGSCVEAWTSREKTKDFPDNPIPEIADSAKVHNRTPSALFNGMLNPLIGYTLKGAIWYQGETNWLNAAEYPNRFAAMVGEWRELWGQGEFPFYYTQISPFDYAAFYAPENYKPSYNSAYIREAQLKSMEIIPNSCMAVTLDIDGSETIHPVDKKTVGERLAFISLSRDYGIEGIGYLPPVVKDTGADGNSITVSFDNIPNGITSFFKPVTEFEIAGENKVFYPANCYVRRKSVVLSSPMVKKPVAVRYAFKDLPEAQLFSVEGIPVPSFRTDDWEK